MNKLFKKNSVLSIIFSLFIILFIMLVAANFLYANQINNILLNWYIDSATSTTSEYFRKIDDVEKDFSKLTYTLFNSNKTFLSYISGNNPSDTASSYANTILYEKATENNLDAIHVYDVKSKKFVTSYAKQNHPIKEDHLTSVVEDFKKGKKWNYVADDNNKNGNLFYITQDFSGFYVVYSISFGFLADKLNISDSNIKDFIVFFDDEYIFNSEYITTGVFSPKNFDDFSFNTNANREYYTDGSLFYIHNTNYKTSVISTYDRNSFNTWKLSVITDVIKLFSVIILLYIVIIVIFYLMSKKKIMYYNTLIKSNKTELSILVEDIIKAAYANITPHNNLILNTAPHFDNYNFFECIMFKIDKIKPNKLQQTSDILKLLFIEIADALSPHYKTYEVICDYDTIIVFLASDKDISENIQTHLSNISGSFEKQTEHTVTLILSDEFYNFTDIYEHLTELNNRKQFRFLYGYNSIITNKNIYTNKATEYPKDIETALTDAIIRADHEKIMEYANDFFTVIIDLNSPLSAREWICSLYFKILRETQFLYNDSEHGFDFIKRVFECDTLDECAVILQEMLPNLELLCSMSHELNTVHFRQLVNDIIEKEYNNHDLNIAYIADKMNITPAYWGQKFIKEFNMPFNSYILNYRINKSLDLLKNTNTKISDIALKCGFSNGTYFTKAFRESKGITPSQYRNQQLNFDHDGENI